MKNILYLTAKLFGQTTFAVVVLLLTIISVSAATITVTNVNDSGAGSLRQAISDATSGDTIDFNLTGCPCTIALTSAELLIDRKNLIINGSGASQLTISGGNARRIFRIEGVMPALVTISGVTIANGSAPGGGGILVQSGKLTISNSIVTGNNSTGGGVTGYGGGIFVNTNSNLNVFNTTITNNTGTANGGGIATTPTNSTGENVTIANSIISNNTARSGGGIFIAASGTLTSVNSNYNDNTATGFGDSGGGIFNRGAATIQTGTINLNDSTGVPSNGGGIFNSGTLSLTRVTVSTNTSRADGGGINNTGTLTITDSTISGNQSGNGGGGINNTSNLTVSGSTISGNMTTGNGGGINNSGTSSLTNSTVSGNQITGNFFGGGINNANNSTTNLTNCTIAFNSNTFRGGGVANDSTGTTFNVGNTIIAKNTAPNRGPDGLGTFVSNGFNLIGNIGNSADFMGFTNGTNGDIVGTNGSPINPLLDPLADNGGATQTHALQSTSPAIDKGNTGFGVVTDQRGNARFVDAPAAVNIPGGNFSDIGAFEFSAPSAASVGVSGRVFTAEKRGLRNASVILIDGEGNFRTINTGSFGYFRFSDVEIGGTYVLLVRSKNFRFTPQIITVADEITNLNLIASP